MILLLLAACKGGAGDGPGEETGTAPPPPGDMASCDGTKDWPVVTEGHQLDRSIDDTTFGYPGMYWVPENPRGLVVMHHGNNQRVQTLFTIEHEEFYNELAKRDIAYMAVDSVGSGWDFTTDASNVDVQRTAEFRDHLIATTALTADVPMFGVGFSAGAGFLGAFANGGLDSGWDVRGVSAHNLAPSSQAPVNALFVSNANDSPAAMASSWESWQETGHAATLHALPEEPLDTVRFSKLESINETRAQNWFDDMVGLGMIDAAGVRLVEPQDAGQALDAFEALQVSEGKPGGALATVQMSVVWRLHIFSADVACEEADAFEAWLLQ